MSKMRRMLDPSIGGEPERRGDERSEAPRSGGSPPIERAVLPALPDSEVPARHVRRRFTTAEKLARPARGGPLHEAGRGERPAAARGAVLVAPGDVARRGGAGVDVADRGRKRKRSIPDKKIEQEIVGLQSRLQRAEGLIEFQKKSPSSWATP